MGLDQDFKNRIKESLSLEEGGRLHAIADKARAVNAPVLIIGLGGSGVDSLLATKKMIYDTIERERKSDGKLSDKPQNIEYLAIDTDESYKRKSYHGIKLNETAGEIRIYQMSNVKQTLAAPQNLPEYISEWLDTSLDNDKVINGAGAVRQLGRLLLMQNIADLNSILEAKIKKVTAGFEDTVPLYVFIIAGISGGTGSGTFIDVPYIVRAMLEQVSSRRPIQQIGILFLPDVNAEKSGISGVTKSSLYANGFAALKELDYLMNIEHVGDKFEIKYGSLTVGRKNDRAVKPYDICLLMSSKDKNGAAPVNGDASYEMVTRVVAETIFNFVLSDDGADNFQSFAIDSWLSNESRNISVYQTEMGDRRHPVSYVYSIAGAASAKLPMDDVMSYLAYKMYQEVQNFWDQRPSDADVDEVETHLGMTKNALVSNAKKGLRPVNTSPITTKIVQENNAQVVLLYDNALKQWEKQIQANLDAMKQALVEELDRDENIVNQHFKDLTKGPVFAQQCLYSGATGRRSVITDMKQYSLDFATTPLSPEQIDNLEQQAALALGDLRKAVFKGGKLEAYLTRMNQFYKARQDVILFTKLKAFCSEAVNILTDKNNTIFDVIADLLRQMMPIFENYGAIKTQAVQQQNDSGVTLSWSIVSTPDFIKELEKRMQENPRFSVNLREVVQEFYKFLFEHVESWKDESCDRMEELNTFIYRQFSNILDNSMDFFLGVIAQSKGMTLTAYCEDIIGELMRKAEVRYPINNTFTTGVTQPGYSFISIPSNSPELLEAARAAGLRAMTAGGASSLVKQSGVRDRIFMMNFMSATPLSMNSDINSFNKVYSEHLDSQKGLHLYTPTKVGNRISDTDWRKLPSPYPETEWVGFDDPKESKINDEYRKILEEGISCGFVVEDSLNKTMTLYFGDEVDIEQLKVDYNIPNAGTIKQKVADDFTKKIEELFSPEGIVKRCKSLTREAMVLDVDGTLKKSYKEIIFIQMYRPRDQIRKMVENYKECMKVLEDVKNRTRNVNAVADYVKCRVTGVIVKHEKKLGTFVYFDQQGAAHDLVTLEVSQSKYPEYYIMQAYMELPDRVNAFLASVATSKINEGTDRDADVKKAGVYKEQVVMRVIENLRYDYQDMMYGEEIWDAYQNLLEATKTLEEQLTPQNPFF